MTTAASNRSVAIPTKGISLSRLLAGVGAAVADVYKTGVWVTAEVLRASGRDGHVYLELSERDAVGRVVAKTQAAIWASTATRIVLQFERSTGMTLGAGIKLLLRARPVFKAQYGFGLEIEAIDPDYTLGDLEARKREIRSRLQAEGVFGNNRSIEPPWNFSAVLVVAPPEGAGLGDFQQEATRLEPFGVCRFGYTFSRFQGESAASDRDRLQAALTNGRAAAQGCPTPSSSSAAAERSTTWRGSTTTPWHASSAIRSCPYSPASDTGATARSSTKWPPPVLRHAEQGHRRHRAADCAARAGSKAPFPDHRRWRHASSSKNQERGRTPRPGGEIPSCGDRLRRAQPNRRPVRVVSARRVSDPARGGEQHRRCVRIGPWRRRRAARASAQRDPEPDASHRGQGRRLAR